MQKYIKFLERIIQYKSRKIIVWGAGFNGQQVKKALLINKINVAYFVDSRQVDGALSPDNLLFEDKTNSMVIVSPQHIPYIREINKTLEKWGWTKDYNFINFATDDMIQDNQYINYFDPFLGFSQIRDIEGFYICGDIKCSDRIVVLGNCTSLPNMPVKSWVDWFGEKIVQDGITLLNGACAGYSSSQEILKLIRDVLILAPKMIIVFNGVIDSTNVNREINYPYYTKFECNILKSRFGDDGKEMKYKEMQTVPSKVLYGQMSSEKNWEHYIRNMRIIHAIADELNIKVFVFLQPSLYYNSAGLLPKEREIFNELYRNEDNDFTYSIANDFYKNVCKYLKKENWFYDLTGIFEGMNGSAYIDEIHYTSTGNEIIGKYILDIVNNSKI